MRNDYEWDAGHFSGADRPAEAVFNETPVGQDAAAIPIPLQGAPADTPVMMYCELYRFRCRAPLSTPPS